MSFWNESRVLKIIAHCSVSAIVWMYRHRDTRRCPPILLLITLKPIVVRFVFKLLFEPMHNVSFWNFQSGNTETMLQLFGYLKKPNTFNIEILGLGVHYKTGQKITKTFIVHCGPLRLKSARIPLLEKCYWNFSCQTTF